MLNAIANETEENFKIEKTSKLRCFQSFSMRRSENASPPAPVYCPNLYCQAFVLAKLDLLITGTFLV